MKELLQTLARMAAMRSRFPGSWDEEVDDAFLREHAHRASLPEDDPLLNSDWDADLDYPFRPMALTAATMTSVLVGKDGAVKIVKRGHTLVEEGLDQLGNQSLIDAVRDYTAASKSLAAMEEEKGELEAKIKDLNRRVEYEPELIQHAIKLALPEGTAGLTVDIVLAPDGLEYELLVNRLPSKLAVDKAFGQEIVARKEELAKNRINISAGNVRLEELGRRIADLRKALPMMEFQIHHLLDSLDRLTLAARLNGDFIGLTLDESGQPVTLVRREINEELTGIPDEIKRQLVARHLSGNEIPETAQKALGINGAIKSAASAIAKAISAPKSAPKLMVGATRAKPAKR